MRASMDSWRFVLAAVSVAFMAGCGQEKPPPQKRNFGGYYGDGNGAKFNDDAKSGAIPKTPLTELKFVRIDGEGVQDVQLGDYAGKKNVVVVFTRGHAGGICLYCSTQTSRLIANYDEFKSRDAEVVVVFPLRGAAEEEQERAKLDEFIQASKTELESAPSKPPFPVVLDPRLAAVNRLDIAKELAKPSTYILDKRGQVRFAYVGQSFSDRPSIKALLAQLDALNGSPGKKEGKKPPAGG